jgi:hypothetical protein
VLNDSFLGNDFVLLVLKLAFKFLDRCLVRAGSLDFIQHFVVCTTDSVVFGGDMLGVSYKFL